MVWLGFQGLSSGRSILLNIANIVHDPLEVDKKTIEQTIEVPLKGSAYYRAKLRPKGGDAPSILTKGQPFHRHWLFYTAVGSSLAAFGTVAALAYLGKDSGETTQSSPTGDILMTMP